MTGIACGQTCASAAPPPTVYFAGVAYTSNAADITTVFPYVSQLLNEQGTAQFDQSLRQTLQHAQLPEHVVFDALGSTSNATDANALALALAGC